MVVDPAVVILPLLVEGEDLALYIYGLDPVCLFDCEVWASSVNCMPGDSLSRPIHLYQILRSSALF